MDAEKRFLRETGKELLLNEMIYNCRREWDKDQIRDREERLLKGFKEIWPAFEEPTVKTSTNESVIHPQKPKVVVKSKAVPQWVLTIQSKFADEPVRFFTNTEAKELSQIRMTQDRVEGIDKNGKNQTLKKSNIFFVCSTNDWPELRDKIIRKTAVQAKKLQPVLEPTKQLHEVLPFIQTTKSAKLRQVFLLKFGRCQIP